MLVLGVDLLAGDGVGEGVPLDRHCDWVVGYSEGYGGGCGGREEGVARRQLYNSYQATRDQRVPTIDGAAMLVS